MAEVGFPGFMELDCFSCFTRFLPLAATSSFLLYIEERYETLLLAAYIFHPVPIRSSFPWELLKHRGYSIEAFKGRMKVILAQRERYAQVMDLATPVKKMAPASNYPALGTALRSSHSPQQNLASWTQWHRHLAHLAHQLVLRGVRNPTACSGHQQCSRRKTEQ